MIELEQERRNNFLLARANYWVSILGIFIGQILAWIFPKFYTHICNNPELSIMVSANLFTLLSLFKAIADRRAVKRILQGVALVFILVGCAGMPQKLDPSLQYRNDMPFCVEGYGCFEGATVLPRLPMYKFELSPKGDAKVDFFVVTTCNRNKTFEPGDAGFTWDVLGLFGKKKSGLKYIYVPLPEREDDGDCPLIFHTYEKEKGRHAWAFIRFEHPKYDLPATLYCDGEVLKFGGVSLCQAKAGLIQWAQFPERVMIQPGVTEKGLPCTMPKKDATGSYAFRVTKEECGYAVLGESGRKHDMITIGYEGELIREVK